MNNIDLYEYPNTILETVVVSPIYNSINETQDFHTCIEILLLAGASITDYAKDKCGFDMGVLGETVCKSLRKFQLELCDIDHRERKKKWVENNTAHTIIDNNCDSDFVHKLFIQTCCSSWNEKIENDYMKCRVIENDGCTHYEYIHDISST